MCWKSYKKVNRLVILEITPRPYSLFPHHEPMALATGLVDVKRYFAYCPTLARTAHDNSEFSLKIEDTLGSIWLGSIGPVGRERIVIERTTGGCRRHR